MDLHNPCLGSLIVKCRAIPRTQPASGLKQVWTWAGSVSYCLQCRWDRGFWREHGMLRETPCLHSSSLHCNAGNVIIVSPCGLETSCVMSAESCLIKIKRLLLLLSQSSFCFALVTLIFSFSPFALSCTVAQTPWLHTNIFVRNVRVVITAATATVWDSPPCPSINTNLCESKGQWLKRAACPYLASQMSLSQSREGRHGVQGAGQTSLLAVAASVCVTGNYTPNWIGLQSTYLGSNLVSDSGQRLPGAQNFSG